jgi:hypothetical protein
MTNPADDRWPTLAEAAALIFAWLPELEAVHLDLDADGIPGAIIYLPGMPQGVVWQAQLHDMVRLDPGIDATMDGRARLVWYKTWKAHYSGRPTQPAEVWRWRRGRVGPYWRPLFQHSSECCDHNKEAEPPVTA